MASNAAAQRPPLPGQRVLDPDRRLGEYGPFDDAFLLELLEPLAEHPIGDVGDRVAQRREAAIRAEQHEDDRPRPAPADQLGGAMELRAQRRRWESRSLA